jgi:hypothetical protein
VRVDGEEVVDLCPDTGRLDGVFLRAASVTRLELGLKVAIVVPWSEDCACPRTPATLRSFLLRPLRLEVD